MHGLGPYSARQRERILLLHTARTPYHRPLHRKQISVAVAVDGHALREFTRIIRRVEHHLHGTAPARLHRFAAVIDCGTTAVHLDARNDRRTRTRVGEGEEMADRAVHFTQRTEIPFVFIENERGDAVLRPPGHTNQQRCGQQHRPFRYSVHFHNNKTLQIYKIFM